MFRDLAVTYHILLNMDDAGMSSVMITNKLMEQYGVTKKQLHEDALRSSMILFPAVFENSTEFMGMHVQGKVLPKEDRDISGEEMKVLPKSVSEFEPHLALYGGEDGLDFYRSIAVNYKNALKPGGYLAFEFGMGQGDDVCAILEENGYTVLERSRDYNLVERAVLAQYGRKEDI